MSRSEAFKLCLNKIKETAPKGTWAAYVHRFKNGKLSDKTINKLLNENGFRVISEEVWEPSKKQTNG